MGARGSKTKTENQDIQRIRPPASCVALAAVPSEPSIQMVGFKDSDELRRGRVIASPNTRIVRSYIRKFEFTLFLNWTL